MEEFYDDEFGKMDIIRNENYCLNKNYSENNYPQYFPDKNAEKSDIIHQDSIYQLASYLAKRHGCKNIIDIGCRKAEKISKYLDEYRIVGVDFGENIKHCRKRFPSWEWIEFDFEDSSPLPISTEDLDQSLIICADVVEHLVDPAPLLVNLHRLMQRSPCCIISTPERDLVRGPDNVGPPDNPHHVREWNLPEFSRLLDMAGLNVLFAGLTENNNRDRQKKTVCAVLANNNLPKFTPAPDGFRVDAFVTAFNEEDIIATTVRHLLEQGCHVHVIDNWSSDRTLEIVTSLASDSRVTFEKFPSDIKPETYEWKQLLDRVDELACASTADWCTHNDADELRVSPWPGVSLKDALFHVDVSGFNAVDHTVLQCPPTQSGDEEGVYKEEEFQYFRFGMNSGHFRQVKTWRNSNITVLLSKFGGHRITLVDDKIYPYKFLTKHYPIRSQSHGIRKIFTERLPKFSPEERALGWHTHYDSISEAHSFVEDPADLIPLDLSLIYRDYLVEAISGIGIR